jgi:L-asparaginase
MRGMHIEIITTGGTIDKVYFDAKGGYEVGPPMVEQILSRARAGVPIIVTQLLRKDSLQMTDADRAAIADAVSRSKCARIIVTHGTDTMVATALALGKLSDKTVVLTGALEPGRFTDSDAPFNLGMAVAAVQTLVPGVYIVANGQIFNPQRVRKNLEMNQFEATDGVD